MKKELDDKWLEELRETMADYQADVPAGGWEKLASALPSAQEPELQIGRRERRIFPVWMRTAVAAVLLLVAGFSTYKYLPIYKTKEQPTLDEYFAEIPETKETPAPVAEEEPTPQEKTVAKVAGKKKTVVEEEIFVPKEEPVAEEKPVEEKPAEEKPAEEKPIERLEVDNKLLTMTDPTPTRRVKKKRESNGWSMGMRMGGNGNINLSFGSEYDDDIENLASPVNGAHFNGGGFFASSSAGKDSTRVATRAEGEPTTRAEDAGAKNNEKLEVLDSENHRAWSAGISVQKQLTKHLAIESGLVYTLLTSDVTLLSYTYNGFNGVYKSTGKYSQKLHYLGVPLKLNATVCDRNNWQIYLNGGMMVERCVAASLGGKSFEVNDWQCSVCGGAGLQYKLTPNIGLYLEPGVAYYFENYSKVKSFYTEHPFNFSMNAGLRLIL